jgi:hypothetical protein
MSDYAQKITQYHNPEYHILKNHIHGNLKNYVIYKSLNSAMDAAGFPQYDAQTLHCVS